MANTDFEVTGTNDAALFTLKIYRGDGMALLAMTWKQGQPPDARSRRSLPTPRVSYTALPTEK